MFVGKLVWEFEENGWWHSMSEEDTHRLERVYTRWKDDRSHRGMVSVTLTISPPVVREFDISEAEQRRWEQDTDEFWRVTAVKRIRRILTAPDLEQLDQSQRSDYAIFGSQVAQE